jgi:hypothetical protein
MGRKKIDKTSIEYLTNNLFHKDDIIGFQFTAGNTPLGIKENRPLDLSCHLNKDKSSVVIDCSEGDLEKAITCEIFKNVQNEYEVSLDKIRDLQIQFKNLGYEVEEDDFAGYWYWFRVNCKSDEIPKHVNNLKNNLKL